MKKGDELKIEEKLSIKTEEEKKVEEKKQEQMIQKNLIIENEQKRSKELNLIKKQEMEKQKRQEEQIKQYYYECYLDGEKCKNENLYINHFKKIHPNDSPFYCYYCNKAFYSMTAIKSHNSAKGHNII